MPKGNPAEEEKNLSRNMNAPLEDIVIASASAYSTAPPLPPPPWLLGQATKTRLRKTVERNKARGWCARMSSSKEAKE